MSVTIIIKSMIQFMQRWKKHDHRKKKNLGDSDVYYWMPDYQNILQRFIWQTMDVKPKYPRVNKFLDHWHNNIDAIVNEIRISESERIY